MATPTTDRDQIISKIEKLSNQMFSNLESPEILSVGIIQLATYNSALGNYLVEANDLERQAETQYKYEYQKAFDKHRKPDSQGKKISEGDAKALAFRETKELLDEHNTTQHMVDIIQIKRRDTEKLIDTIRSRLSFIKGEMKG